MPETMTVQNFEQLKVMAAAQRLAILRRLMVGPASLTALGRHFGTTPAHIRHHLQALERAGLVALASTHPVRGFTEKRYRATAAAYLVQTAVLPEAPSPYPLVVLGSNDRAVESLAEYIQQAAAPLNLQRVALDSLNGLIALRQGVCHLAGCHLLDPQTGDYNTAYIRTLFPGQAMVLVRLAQREVGLIVRPGNPRHVTTLADLMRPGVQFVNRERGSGTRLWLDQALRHAGLPVEAIAGYSRELGSHAQVVEAVAQGQAEAGLALTTVARQSGLDYVPLYEEPYDLVAPQEALAEARYQLFFDLVCSGGFRRHLTGLPGYNARTSGARRELPA